MYGSNIYIYIYHRFVRALEGPVEIVLNSISGKGEPLKNLSAISDESGTKKSDAFSPKKKVL